MGLALGRLMGFLLGMKNQEQIDFGVTYNLMSGFRSLLYYKCFSMDRSCYYTSLSINVFSASIHYSEQGAVATLFVFIS